MVGLIRQCWAADAAIRPSFSVIIQRFTLMKQANDAKTRTRSATAKQHTGQVRTLCRSIHGLLQRVKPGQWSELQARACLAKDVVICASDKVLNKILRSEGGPNSAKSLGWLMFGGLGDGSEIIVEPLLDEDIAICRESAIVSFRFHAKGPLQEQLSQEKNEREFDGLARALAEGEHALEAEGAQALDNAVAENVAAAKPKLRSTAKLRRKIRKRTSSFPQRKKDPFARFVKAARYVRGIGSGTVHPSAKLRLFGLFMQVQRGDIPDKLDTMIIAELEGSALALQQLKLESWRAQKKKSRKDAMKEYVEFLTSIAPQWAVAHLIGGSKSLMETKPREMMWVLKIEYREMNNEEMSASMEKMPLPNKLHREQRQSQLGEHLQSHLITSIEVIQAGNEAGGLHFSDMSIISSASSLPHGTEKSAKMQEQGGSGKEMVAQSGMTKPKPASADDSFYANFPQDLTLEDCIVDKAKHKTIEEQRSAFQTKMREAARPAYQGFNYYRMSNFKGVPAQEQVEIYERIVDWSSSKQMRTDYDTDLSVEEVFRFLMKTFQEETMARAASKQTSAAVKKALRKKHTLFSHYEALSAVELQYRTVTLPWP